MINLANLEYVLNKLISRVPLETRRLLVIREVRQIPLPDSAEAPVPASDAAPLLERFRALVAGLGEALNIPDLELDDDNECCLRFDESLAVLISLLPRAKMVKLLAYVGRVPSMMIGYYIAILRSCHMWRDTLLANLSVDDEGLIVLSHFVNLDFLDASLFFNAVEGFVSAVEYWKTTAMEKLLDADPELDRSRGGPHDVDQPNPATVEIAQRDYSGMKEIRVLREAAAGASVLAENPENQETIVLEKRDQVQDVAKFVAEVEILARCRHPCVVGILGYSRASPQAPAQFARCYYAKGTLRELLDQKAAGSAPEWLTGTAIAKIAVGIVIGMRFVHSRGIIHRDLRPENIYLDEKGHPRIGGFGNATFADRKVKMEKATTTEAALYRAPEVYGDEATKSVDLYSFALILYELVTGRPVFDRSLLLEAFEQAVNGGVRPPVPADLHPNVKGVITAGWSATPGDRWSSFDSIVTEWESFQYVLFPGAFWRQVSDYAASAERLNP
jgi:hypothetical protein